MVRKINKGVLKLTKTNLGSPYMVLKFREKMGQFRELINLGSFFKELLEMNFSYSLSKFNYRD